MESKLYESIMYSISMEFPSRIVERSSISESR